MPLSEAAAATAMWHFYRDHKAQLAASVREHRAAILAHLQAGVPVQQVIAPHFKTA